MIRKWTQWFTFCFSYPQVAVWGYAHVFGHILFLGHATQLEHEMFFGTIDAASVFHTANP